jgi:hypothetical protein
LGKTPKQLTLLETPTPKHAQRPNGEKIFTNVDRRFYGIYRIAVYQEILLQMVGKYERRMLQPSL